MCVVAVASDRASAAELCDGIDALQDSVRAGHTGAFPEEFTTAGHPECSFGQSPTGRFYACFWEFPYRSPEARERFEALAQLMRDCGRTDPGPTRDTPVNHPDSYALRQYAMGGATVFVSIKDKGGLSRTFVFLRIETAHADRRPD